MDGSAFNVSHPWRHVVWCGFLVINILDYTYIYIYIDICDVYIYVFVCTQVRKDM